MIANLAQVLAWIDEDEGPEVNISPDEPGGGSARGLTVEVWNEYNKVHGLPVVTVADLSKVTAALSGQIFQWRYLDPLRFNDLPAGIDYRMADLAITLGETGACLLVQMCLTLWPTTGIMDDATLAAIKGQEPIVLLTALDGAWLAWKHNMAADGWGHYGHGWTNRILKVRPRYTMMLK
jgi:lysozyme family protein